MRGAKGSTEAENDGQKTTMRWSGKAERKRVEQTTALWLVKCDEAVVRASAARKSPLCFYDCAPTASPRTRWRIAAHSKGPFLHDPNLYREIHEHSTGRTSSVADRSPSFPQFRRMMNGFLEASIAQPIAIVPEHCKLVRPAESRLSTLFQWSRNPSRCRSPDSSTFPIR